MSAIVPAILPTSGQDLEEKLSRLVGVATEVQIDIVDGVFATPTTWPYRPEGDGMPEDGLLPHLDDFRAEIDLMVHDPEQAAGAWIEAGATRLTLHLESATHLDQFLGELAQRYGHERGMGDLLSIGLALNLDTELVALDPYLDRIDYVQFMGIRDIGKQGQPFDTAVLNRIAVFRKAHPDLPIQVDGGVNIDSAPLLLNAGVSRLIIGSALWKAENLPEAYRAFTELNETHGWYA